MDKKHQPARTLPRRHLLTTAIGHGSIAADGIDRFLRGAEEHFFTLQRHWRDGDEAGMAEAHRRAHESLPPVAP